MGELIEIRDVGMLTILKMHRIKAAESRVEYINGKPRVVYLFDRDGIGSLLDDYFGYRTVIEARTFAKEMKATKEAIYADKLALTGTKE